MLWAVRRLFHAMFATPAAPVAADVSAASLFFKDLEERQQKRGLLRCLHAALRSDAGLAFLKANNLRYTFQTSKSGPGFSIVVFLQPQHEDNT